MKTSEKKTMYVFHQLAALLMLLTLLGGCVMGPDYQRSAELAPEAYRNTIVEAPEAATSGTLLADMPWWEMFQDPQLQVLIQTALEHNQDLKIAATRIEEARMMLGVAAADQYPVMGAKGLASRERTPDSFQSLYLIPGGGDEGGLGYGVAPARSNYYSALLELSYEVDLWGRVRRSKEAARANLLASEETRNTIISSLVTEVARSYFALLELDRETEITSNTLSARDKTLALMESRRDQGVASELEISRFRAEVAGAKAALAVLQKQTWQGENALSILLGQAPQDIARSAGLHEQTLIPSAPAGLPSDLLERRPDVQAAEQQLIAATANIGAAKAALFPRIALTADYGFQSVELQDLLQNDNLGWSIAGAAAQPIFTGKRSWLYYKLVQARREQALQNYHKTVLQALHEVSDALIAKKQSALEREQREVQVEAIQNAVRLSGLRYRAGHAGYLELLDAEQQLYAAELLLERACLEELLSSIRLYKALGGGVETPPASEIAAD
ncbi:efflux transporter outer membrane subunit [Candidatus Sumerlaeota bacterium]|nr:efflux transporter outer membrane subunit [Candidatus Sumerlaeota bacterium]